MNLLEYDDINLEGLFKWDSLLDRLLMDESVGNRKTKPGMKPGKIKPLFGRGFANAGIKSGDLSGHKIRSLGRYPKGQY